MPIRSFLQPGAFEPEAIAAMSEALEATLKELQDTGQAVAPEVIAGRIIAAARLAWISTERNRPNIQIAKRFTRLKNPPVAVGQISVLIDPCA